MKQIMSITVGTIILLLALSSFEPVNRNVILEGKVEVGEAVINTPADVTQYIKEVTDDKTSIPAEQVL
tara:strand:- start:209 stop:412 length:204 start_codon:yes stop_codon:yes gene_type:complete